MFSHQVNFGWVFFFKHPEMFANQSGYSSPASAGHYIDMKLLPTTTPPTPTHTNVWTVPNPAAAQTSLSPASYSQPVANSFRQAWERGRIQAGSGPRAARSGRTNRGSGQEIGPLPQGPRPLVNPLFC